MIFQLVQNFQLAESELRSALSWSKSGYKGVIPVSPYFTINIPDRQTLAISNQEMGVDINL